MILIHQVKSGGSSLKAGLVRDLNMTEYKDSEHRPTITARNSKPEKLMYELRPFAEDKKAIRGVHLHPTQTVINIFKNEGIKSVVLLRNPYDSFEAAKRHRTTDNQKKRVHQIYRRFGEDALEQLVEFNHNWRTLVGLNQCLFISFDEVIENYPEVIRKIANFYDMPLPDTRLPLPKVRYSGAGGGRPTDLSATNGLTEKFHPYNKRKALTHAFFEHVPAAFRFSGKCKRLLRIARK